MLSSATRPARHLLTNLEGEDIPALAAQAGFAFTALARIIMGTWKALLDRGRTLAGVLPQLLAVGRRALLVLVALGADRVLGIVLHLFLLRLAQPLQHSLAVAAFAHSVPQEARAAVLELQLAGHPVTNVIGSTPFHRAAGLPVGRSAFATAPTGATAVVELAVELATVKLAAVATRGSSSDAPTGVPASSISAYSSGYGSVWLRTGQDAAGEWVGAPPLLPLMRFTARLA